jgi:hypothetical protein
MQQMSRTEGPDNGARPQSAQAQETGQQAGDGEHPDGADGHARRRADAEREAGDFTEQTGYQPSVNQGRDEPMPASRHDERRQEAVVQNEDHNSGQAGASPAGRAQRRDRG